MALSLKKKMLWGSAAFAVAVVGTVGSLMYLLTRPLDVDFAQDPNAVEAFEANRKLKLLNEAQTDRRQGFIRLSEVEINSFLEGRYNTGKNPQTNSPIRLVKSGVMLDQRSITFVTWHKAPLLGFELPFVWQRVVTPSSSTNGWDFDLHSMRVGRLDIPYEYWAHVQKVLGGSDSLFEERKSWLRDLPFVSLSQNEQSKSPEFRLYTYLPREKSNATPSE